MLFKISNSFLITQKVAYFVCKDSSSPVKANNFNPLNPDLLTLLLPSKPDQNMTNLRCSADQHAEPPLNIRSFESGIIPDRFLTGWKNYPAHHDLSERARPTPGEF